MRDLTWLGLDWDEGPTSVGRAVHTGSRKRLHLYGSYAKELLACDQAYYCFCSREKLEAERREALAAGRPARYSGTCRSLSADETATRMAAGERPAIRFRVPENREVVFTDLVRGEVRFHTDVIGDPVIVRAEGIPPTTLPWWWTMR
jgi:glutamyl/glutaminyl-tRNA synthetase